MPEKSDVPQGTLALMALKTLDLLGPLHGYGIARRIEQISGDLLAVNQGTLYPLLLKLEHEGAITSDWGISENNRRARFYRLTKVGRRQLQAETGDWGRTSAIVARFFTRLHRYYEPLRHPKRPGLALASFKLIPTANHRWGFPCCI